MENNRNTMASKENDGMERVGTVSTLFLYPIKACQPIKVPSAECTPLGLKVGHVRDRGFMVVNSKNVVLQCKQEPTLCKIEPSLPRGGEPELWVDAPGKERLVIDLNELNDPSKRTHQKYKVLSQFIEGIDCGEKINSWFSTYLNKDVKLIYYSDDIEPRFIKDVDLYKHLVQDTDIVAFSNNTGYMMLSRSSVDDLNERFTRKMVVERFRPNIYIDDTSPYAEDKWQLVRINENVRFRFIKKCTRCFNTTVDPETAKPDKDYQPFMFLKTYRVSTDPETIKYAKDRPIFGINFGIDQLGKISVGDPVYATMKAEGYWQKYCHIL